MLGRYLDTPLEPGRALQQQLRERIVEAILAGVLTAHEPLPATRVLAKRLGLSRNTVALVYDRLTQDGYLAPRPRRGYFVHDRYLREQLNVRFDDRSRRLFATAPNRLDYAARFRFTPSAQHNIVKPANWREFAYPFVYGQIVHDPVSVSRWRECLGAAGTARHLKAWTGDLVDADDPLLIEQIIRRILPKRGFAATPAEILVTVGAQNAIALIATLLAGPGTRVAMEEPGYVDARNVFLAHGAEIVPQMVDRSGLRVGEELAGCGLVYVTPSHQAPTNVTLSVQRRLALLTAAERHDLLVIEDDYEHELNFVGPPHPALKSFDQSERVIHIGSLSKPLFPGLRLGFVAGPEPVIRELRAVRRLHYRHPSALDQRAMALFLEQGFFDAHLRRHREQLGRKWKTILQGLERLRPNCSPTMTTGGSAVWLSLPQDVRAEAVRDEAALRSVLVEPGDVHYFRDDAPKNRLRLGFGAIAGDRILPGLQELAAAIETVIARGDA